MNKDYNTDYFNNSSRCLSYKNVKFTGVDYMDLENNHKLQEFDDKLNNSNDTNLKTTSDKSPDDEFARYCKMDLKKKLMYILAFIVFSLTMIMLIVVRNITLKSLGFDLPLTIFKSGFSITFISAIISWLRKDVVIDVPAYMEPIISFVYKIGKSKIARKAIKHTAIFLCTVGIAYCTPVVNAMYSNLTEWACTQVSISGTNVPEQADEKLNSSNSAEAENKSEIFICDDSISFILDDRVYNISDELKQKAFIADTSENISQKLDRLFSSEKPKSDYQSFSYEIQSKENDFSYMKSDAAEFAKSNNRDKQWHDMLPHENTMLEVIRLQEAYAASYGNYFMHNRISNNYQLLALEYLRQEKNSNTAKYYYLKSIVNDVISIKYAENEYEFRTAKNRIKYRYKDILAHCMLSDNEKLLLESYISNFKN